MTNYEYLTSKNINELAHWLSKHGQFEESPWMEWFNENYCEKCESIIKKVSLWGNKPRDCECAWCEIHDKCKFFQDMEEQPHDKDILKMWLESEMDNE